jgi:hypothetical protein
MAMYRDSFAFFLPFISRELNVNDSHAKMVTIPVADKQKSEQIPSGLLQ